MWVVYTSMLLFLLFLAYIYLTILYLHSLPEMLFNNIIITPLIVYLGTAQFQFAAIKRNGEVIDCCVGGILIVRVG